MTDLPRAAAVEPAGTWTGDAAGTVRLDAETRRRRRLVLRAEEGFDLLLDLEAVPDLKDGDALVLGDGRRVRVRTADEDLLEVLGRDPHHLLRLAWHLGNRHVPAEVRRDRLLIRADHVLAAMLEGLGAGVRPVRGPFAPEGGAYAHHHAPG